MNAILIAAVMMLSIALSASLPSHNFAEYSDLIPHEIDADMDPGRLTDYLLYLLSAPNEAEYPLVVLQDENVPPPISPISKRSRYYRRYPWKRQQNNGIYEPDGYLCTPTRDDVFQLLIALHEARSGNTDKTVSFCNRRRPARAILTSMRFIGKR